MNKIVNIFMFLGCFVTFILSVITKGDFFAWGIASTLSLYILIKEWKTNEL